MSELVAIALTPPHVRLSTLPLVASNTRTEGADMQATRGMQVSTGLRSDGPAPAEGVRLISTVVLADAVNDCESAALLLEADPWISISEPDVDAWGTANRHSGLGGEPR